MPYTGAQIVDTLPRLGGQLVFSYTAVDIVASGGGAWMIDTATPGVITFTAASGGIGGRVDGPSSLTILLSGIISNEVAAQQGDIFTNSLRLADYVDGQSYSYTDTVSAVVKEPILGISKAAAPVRGVRADSTITYTLLITHTAASDATAYNVVITDVVPPSLAFNPGSLIVSAPAPGAVTTRALGNNLAITVSEYPTPAPPIYITFTASAGLPLEPSSFYTNTAYVRYTSQPGDNPSDRDGSGSGPNDYWSSSHAAFDTAAVAIGKALPDNLDFSIGDLVTYTVLITVPAGTTRGLRVIDTVPAGLLYQAPTGTVAVDAPAPIALAYVITPSSGSGTAPSSAVLSMTAPVVNSTGAPAVITWTLRLLVVDDPNRTVNYNGAQKTNRVDALYVNAAGQLQSLTDNAPSIRLFEPLLHIGKDYVTEQVCSAYLLGDNFNTNSIANWTIASPPSPAWSVAGGWLRAPSISSTVQIHGADAWTDISFSAIFSSTDTDGGVGLIFRAEDAANYYRFVWTRTGTGAGTYQVTKMMNGIVDDEQIQNLDASGGYIPNRWYHLEIRSNALQHAVFIDGRQVFTYTDNSEMPFRSGSVGFYAADENGLAFDDALVTELGEAGCMVDVNDLVTYTLTISNQERLVGHNLVISDVLPPLSLEYVGYSMASSDPAATVTAAPAPGTLGTLAWNVDQLASLTPFDPLKHGWLVLTVTARIVGDVTAGVRLPNQAVLTYDGQADNGPDGVQRTYSGGSHSTGIRTPSVALLKVSSPAIVTIGQRLNYTLTLPAAGGLPATLYTATLTDAVPSGFRLVAPPEVSWSSNALAPTDVDASRSTAKTVLVDFTRIPSNTEVTVAITAVVENVAANQDGVRYTNTATLGWYDLGGSALPPQTSNAVSTRLAEPQLVIEKVAAPKGVRPGDIVFYHIRVYHAATSTVPAYDVVISDIVPSGLSHISGSWSRNNEPTDLAATGYYTEQSPRLAALFPVISTTIDAANPLDLSFQAVVDLNASLGSLITNVVTTTWQSLPTDPDGERRSGAGGVDDYVTGSQVSVSLDSFNLDKTGPLSATAGSLITYVVTLQNNSAGTGHNAIVRDNLPFQIAPITATFSAPLRSGACDLPFTEGSRPTFSCSLSDMPPYSSAVITLTGRIDPATPDGTLLDNYAAATLTDSNGALRVLTDEAETWVYSESDLTIWKTGPATATAGGTISYTIVVTNTGPSYARSVDVKDQLPPGLSLDSITADGGVCAGPLCQFGNLPVDSTRTVTVVARVSAAAGAGVITNTAGVFSPDAPVVTKTATTQITNVARLSAAKVALNSPVNAGEVVFFQVVVANQGPSDAQAVVVTDTLPAGLTYAGGDAACTASGSVVVCALGSLPAGSARSLLVEGRTATTLTDGLRLTNSITATSPTVAQPVTATVGIIVRQVAGTPVDLRLAKSGPLVATAGATVRYTLTVTNQGPVTATAANLLDALPPGVNFVAATASQGLCQGGVACQLGDLAAGASATVIVTGLVHSQLVTGTQVVNAAQAGSANSELTPADNRAAYTTTVQALALLTLTKRAAAANVLVGDLVQYQIVVTNGGPSTARAVTVADLMPAAVANALVSSSRGGCMGFPCSLGDLEPGAAATIVVAGIAATGGVAYNQATVTSITDLDPASILAAGALVTIAPFADLALHKAAAPTAVAGSQVAYTLTVYNDGPSDAAYITVTDALPAQAVFAAAAAGCNAAGGVVTCLAPVLGAGMTRTFVITATTAADLALGSSIENRAIVSAATLDPRMFNNLDDADTSIIGQAELAITKVDLFDPVTAGGLVTYTIAVTNSGPSAARAVDVADLWPSGMSLVAIAASDSGQCTAGICRFGTLAAGATRTVTVTLRVAPETRAGTLANVASVYSPDSRAAVPSVVTKTTTITTAAVLRVTKAVLNNPAVAGGQQSYQVVVYNDGPSDADSVRVVDTLPAVTTYAGGAAECSAASQVVTCDLGILPAGASRGLLINVTVDPPTPDGMVITNAVTATSPTARDPVTASAATIVRQPQGGVVDLAVAKFATPHTTAGESITYTLVVTNSGPSSAQNVQLVDALPLSVTILALHASQGTCAAGMVCQLGDLAPGTSATVQLTGVVSAYAVSGTVLLNTVQAGSSNVDAAPANNTAGAVTTVDNRVLLTIDKEAAVTTVAPGSSLSYRIIVHNGGPSLARSVVITDLLPPQLLNPLLSSSRGSCGATACSLGELPPGDTVTILVMGTVSPFATGSIENRAVLTTTAPLDPGSVLADAVTVLVGDTADLALVKTAVPSVYAGQTITYVLNVYNTGPSPAAGVQIADQLPLSVTVVSLDSACTAAGGQVHCPSAPAALAANGQLSFTLVVATDASLATGTVLENRATVTSQTPDPNPLNNSATAGTTIIGQADLHVHKSSEPSRVLAGENLTYTIVVTNAGPSNAATVRLVDILPAAVSQIGPVQTQRTQSQVPIVCLNLVCELGAVPLGEVITLTLPVHVYPAVADGTVFTNTVTVHSPSDPDPDNNVGAAAATAYRQSTLLIQKSAAPDPAVTGADLLYTIQVANLGPSDADGVTVADLLPPGFAPGAVTSSQGACTELPCTLGTLAPGATAAITIRGRVSPTQGGALVNTASVTATTPLTDSARSTTTITTPVTSSADLQLILRSTPTALAGMTATVYASLVNHGPSAAIGAVVTLTLPSGATFNQAQLPAGWTATPAAGVLLLASDQTLPPGAEIPLAIVVDFDPGIRPGASLEFAGVVASTTPDPTPSNNTATADTSVLAQADLAISKSGPIQLPAGGLVTYTVVVQNRGPSTAAVRDLKDSLPAGLELVAAALEGAAGLTACAGAVCQSTRPLTVGELLTMTVIAQVDPTLAPGMLLTNTATVFADAATPDPVDENNQASHTAPVVALAQIAIDKYDLVDPVYPDALLAYAIVVANQGPSTAAGLVVTDTLPGGVTYMSSTGACVEAPAGVLTCDIGTLAAGERAAFQVMVHVGAAVPNGAVLHNTVILTSTTPLTQSVLGADEDTRVLVPRGPLADLEVVKTVAPPVVQPGSLLTFTLVVTNNGPSPASSAQLLDLLPDGLQLVRVAPSQGYCNAGISCLLGTLNYLADGAGAPTLRGTATVTIVARAALGTLDAQVLTNTAFVQSERQDPVPENNLASAEVTVLPSTPLADVQLEKQDPAGVSNAGGLITYTLRVYNAGPSAAANVVVTDPLPAGLTYVAAQPAPTGGSPAAPAWLFGAMPAGALAYVTLVVRSDAQALAGLLIRNTASVTTTTQDPVPQNNAATAESQVFGAVDLEVQKTAVPTYVLAAESITYVITVTDHGPSAAQDVDVTEQLPPSVTLTSLTPSRGVCVSEICQFGAVAGGEEIVVTATVQADRGLLPGTVLTNTAAGFTDTPDRDPGNNESRAPIIIGPLVNLEVAKIARAMTATVGTAITYTVIVTNLGPSLSPNVMLTDVVPNGFVYLRTTNPSGCECLNRWYVTCPLGPMAAGRSLAIDLVFFIEFVRPGSVTNRVVVHDPSAYHLEGEAQGQSVVPSDPKGPTAVTLERFDVTVVENALVITWQTVHELDTWSFQLYRNTVNDRETAELITPQPILSHGSGSLYSYTDMQVASKQLYYYWLQELGASGIQKEIDRIQGGIDLAPAPKVYLPYVEGCATP